MAIKHAPYAALGDIVFAHAQTTKTACGKRVRTDQLATRDAATCPDCRRVIAADRERAAETRAITEDLLRASGCPQCGAPFNSLAAWNQHRIEHHERTPDSADSSGRTTAVPTQYIVVTVGC